MRINSSVVSFSPFSSSSTSFGVIDFEVLLEVEGGRREGGSRIVEVEGKNKCLGIEVECIEFEICNFRS